MDARMSGLVSVLFGLVMFAKPGDGALVLLIAMWLACLLGLIIGRFRT